MISEDEKDVLCAASSYTKKFYLNPMFDGLPSGVKQELQIMCVMHTEDVGGTITLYFEEDGTLSVETDVEEDDLLYDEIGSALKVKQIQREKRDLFESLEQYYRVFFLGEDA